MADLVVLVMGNICAGKTTFVDYVEKNKDEIQNQLDSELTVYPEPIDQVWRRNFYRNRKKHTFGFELHCLSMRMARYIDAKDNGGLYLFDRGMIEGAEIFANNSYDSGFLRHNDYKLYERILRNSLDDLGRSEPQKWLEKLIVYLKVEDTNVLVERNIKRAREQNVEVVPPSYLRRINDRYTHMMKNLDEVYGQYAVPVPDVLSLDASQDMNGNGKYHANCLSSVLKRIKEIQEKK